jgi:T5orf172 domain
MPSPRAPLPRTEREVSLAGSPGPGRARGAVGGPAQKLCRIWRGKPELWRAIAGRAAAGAATSAAKKPTMTMLVEKTGLTAAELAFLEKYGLSASNVYDGRGQSKAKREAAAKQGGFDLILAAGCTNGGHRLKTRSGHCAQCDTSKLARQTRYNTPGSVYIAGSLRTKLLKIGSTDDVEQRERTLQYERGYGSAPDWKVLFHAKVAKKGEVEGAALRSLERYKVPRPYVNGSQQEAAELLNAPFSEALVAVADAIGPSGCDDPWMSPSVAEYEWA